MNDNFLYIDHPKCNAIISLQGAQILQWNPKNKPNVLWCSDFSTFEQGKAFRGGIPLCWPWFGKIKSPSHGFARLLKWNLEKHEECQDNVTLTFTLQDSEETFKLFPHHFSLTLTMVLKDMLSLSLEVVCDIETTGALHAYFKSQDVSNEVIYGLGDFYTDALDNHNKTWGETPLIVQKEVDRVYIQSLPTTKIISEDRILTLLHKGYSDIVVWNPWRETSRNIHDMQTNDYLNMFCIETARINKNIKKKDTISISIELS